MRKRAVAPNSSELDLSAELRTLGLPAEDLFGARSLLEDALGHDDSLLTHRVCGELSEPRSLDGQAGTLKALVGRIDAAISALALGELRARLPRDPHACRRRRMGSARFRHNG
jgi:hypothetical protein